MALQMAYLTLYYLHMAFSLYMFPDVSSSYKDTSAVGLGTNLMTSFNLNYLFKGPISKCSHSLRYLGLGLKPMNLEGTQIIVVRTLLTPTGKFP